MSDYDYGNARIKAMKSRLLSRKELVSLTEVGNLDSLIANLVKTPYRPSIEIALTRTVGMECITQGLHSDLIQTLGKVRSFYRDGAAHLVGLIFQAYDIHNLKTILRGLAKNASTSEILPLLMPVGEIKYNMLVNLSNTRSPRAAIDLMVSLGSLMSRPLLVLRAEHPGADVSEMELALDGWHDREARKVLREEAVDSELLLSALNLEADISNLMIALRFAQTPDEFNFLQERLGTTDLKRLFIGPGLLSFNLLIQASGQSTIGAAMELLSGTPYQDPAKTGVEAYRRTGRLSEIEKVFRKFRLHWMASKISEDPLGIGVVLGYVALKTNEGNNIRWIAQGVDLGLKADSILNEMELPA